MDNKEYDRLLILKKKVKERSATKAERKEYMAILYRNGNISKGQYDKFLNNQSSEEIINAGLTIGGVLLATWLLTKLLSDD